jgi:hypothetical protein
LILEYELMKLLLALALSSILAGGLSPTCVRASDLDQEFAAGAYYFSAGVGNAVSRAQTFTVARHGYLYRIDLQVSRSTGTSLPALLELRSTLGNGAPDPSATGLLASASLAPASFPNEPYTQTFTSFELGASPLVVSPGQLLAAVLTSGTPVAPGAWYLWSTSDSAVASSPPKYPRGDAWYRIGSQTDHFVNAARQSSGFRTYVRPVPEPAGVAVAATSLIGLLLMRRRDH